MLSDSGQCWLVLSAYLALCSYWGLSLSHLSTVLSSGSPSGCRSNEMQRRNLSLPLSTGSLALFITSPSPCHSLSLSLPGFLLEGQGAPGHGPGGRLAAGFPPLSGPGWGLHPGKTRGGNGERRSWRESDVVVVELFALAMMLKSPCSSWKPLDLPWVKGDIVSSQCLSFILWRGCSVEPNLCVSMIDPPPITNGSA